MDTVGNLLLDGGASDGGRDDVAGGRSPCARMTNHFSIRARTAARMSNTDWRAIEKVLPALTSTRRWVSKYPYLAPKHPEQGTAPLREALQISPTTTPRWIA